MTTRNEISGWFDEGKAKGATHMIVVCDTYDYEDFPVYVMPGEDVEAAVKRRRGPNMQKVMEVYNLGMDAAEQLEQPRAWNL